MYRCASSRYLIPVWQEHPQGCEGIHLYALFADALYVFKSREFSEDVRLTAKQRHRRTNTTTIQKALSSHLGKVLLAHRHSNNTQQ